MLAGLAAVLFLLSGFLPSGAAFAQSGTLAGTVTSADDGEPLPGVNVVLAGTQQGTSTGPDGSYRLTGIEPGTYAVRASFIGYATGEETGVVIEAGETTELDFALAARDVGLDEVVVVGYGTQERRDLTGAVSKIDGAAISEVATPTATEALQGQVAGVQVTPSSGEPGADAVVRIRGVGTLNDASPLYVVDGMLVEDITFLNPNDIESVEVLKDASATAIYGSRGANGVIIVSTKQGSRNQETIYSVNTYWGFNEVADPIDLTNARQYAALANELRANQGQSPAFDNPDQFGEGTDWQDVVYRQAPTQNYQVSARGGSESISFNLSGNYVREKGVLEGSDFQRATFRLNNNYQLSEGGAVGLRFGHNVAFTYRTGREAAGVVGNAYRADPTIAPRGPDGAFNDAGVRSSAGNPAAAIFYERNEFTGNRLVGNVFVEASFLDRFRLRSSFGLDVDERETRDLTPEFFVSPTQQVETSSINVNTSENSSWLWENTLSYDDSFAEIHQVEAVAGVTAQRFRTESLGGGRLNPIGFDESLWFLNAGQAEGQTNFNSAGQWRLLSFLGRVNYSLLDRYLFTVTGRADGSSRFGDTNRYGFFPSFAVGWRLSDEPFLADVEALSNLKLRGSWGIVGNDKIGFNPAVPAITGNINAVFGNPGSLQFGASQVNLANSNIQWEETRQVDVGLELGFFEERLTAEFDYYRRTTDGILIAVPIPDFVGVNQQPTVNAAQVLNSGLEASLNWQGSVGDVSYGIGLNGSTVNNEVEELGQGREAIFGGGLVNEIAFTTLTEIGRPIGSFYGFQVAGIFQTQEEVDNLPTRGGEQPGDLRFADLNGDGQITDDDRTHIGSPIPDFFYGINLNASYRGVDLSLSFSGESGRQIFNAKEAVRFGIENWETKVLDRWTGPGTSSSVPRITNAGHNFLASERFIEDAAYFKLRNVQLGYSLPPSLVGPLNVQQLRLYVSGANVFTITDYTGYTPEIGSEQVIATSIDDGIFPVSRTFTAGVNLTF
jgi:TonB-linked SusC/RagA family outer membrane protein